MQYIINIKKWENLQKLGKKIKLSTTKLISKLKPNQ